MKLSDRAEVCELADRIEAVERQRKLLAEKAEVRVRIFGIEEHEEDIDGSTDAGVVVISAVEAYLDGVRADCLGRLKKLGVEAA